MLQKRNNVKHESIIQKRDSILVPARQPSYWRGQPVKGHLSDKIHLTTERLEKALQTNQTLRSAYEEMDGDPQSKIPFLVWLLENPDSPLSLPGKIYLYKHDYLHLLLKRGFSLDDEAFIVGFTMGNDSNTKWFHIALFKLISSKFYPKKYQFTKKHFQEFYLGFEYGKKVKTKNINSLDFELYYNKPILEIREQLGIT
ncbi:hypothetical protein DSM106972_044440 [Dulcicalothrix desertica PCC 7102]|uniref:Uncharacterized protein n=1 Tax=Dulcicalothrix desertica PCC 7102 TaxID=232991 RepID=A0A433VDM8_9CYAN|nr:hypothetical protein DSM106972_044440 [Dulcicalothrix desertica PCC 7102]